METVSEPTEKVLGSLVDRKTAARLLGVSKMHITNLIDSGQLRAFDVAVTGSRYRQVRIPVCELKKFLSTRLLT
ncbi:MAG: helix-turn-helix domain-containing protein [Verrucomicrobia bacterium]|nr:helix-turn-helix domain-containing protein [Verrucomicrobiota bacterium]MBR4248809.1 helix-turn-helix domain-containing protein [Verrucomicrobiota bacterium]